MTTRKCLKCGADIPPNTSEIYDPAAINPKYGEPGQGFYLELCLKCAEKKLGYKIPIEGFAVKEV